MFIPNGADITIINRFIGFGFNQSESHYFECDTDIDIYEGDFINLSDGVKEIVEIKKYSDKEFEIIVKALPLKYFLRKKRKRKSK